jgi:hypothetical protein
MNLKIFYGLIFFLVFSTGTAFADHIEVTVIPAVGSGFPGCEDTVEGCFLPNTVTVDVGGKVIFKNTDGLSRTFTSGDPVNGPSGEFNSQVVEAFSSFEWVPKVVGNVDYYDIVHPWMKGLIIVQGAEEGNIAESEFSYTPKSESIETTTNFEVDAGSSGIFDVKYTIKGGTVKDMIVDSDIFAIIVQIESTDKEGVITLDLPREFIGAEKQDGKDDTFIILIDDIEVAYQESVVHSDSRVITINFENGDSDIEIIVTPELCRYKYK